jgi:hypothetical protein
VLVVATLGVAAACSGSGDPAPETTMSTPTSPPTTDAPTTTSTPPTTEAPTTTIDPNEALAAEVEADLLEALRLGREAEQDPFNAEKEAAALDRRLGVIAENFAATLADYRERNLAIRPNDDVPATVTVEGEPTFVGAAGDFAEVQVCEVNSWVLVEVGAGPDGADAIVNPDTVATRSTLFMRRVDETWRFEGASRLAEWDGAESCPVV